VQVALDTIRNNPTSRRIIINAWRPDEFDQMALPPCHVLYQFIVNVEKHELNLCMYQRSCDMFLGVPMNIFGSALMLHLFAAATGLKPRHFTHFLADAHIYVNHVDQVKEQLTRDPLPLPQLLIHHSLYGANANELAAIEPYQIALGGYAHHPAIRGEMVTG
jgi:thymidylate synthase